MSDYRRLVEQDGTDQFERLGAILQAIGQEGSLNRAAARLGISYRQAWGLLQRAESRLEAPLLLRRTGGAQGGGTDLTQVGHEVLSRWHALRSGVAQILGPGGGGAEAADPTRPVLLASTIGPVETGLLDELEAAFHRATGLWVRHIAAGTGQALAIARAGRVDLVLTHAPEQEAAFVAEGFGAARHPLMSNDFVLVGPPHDPAGVRTAPGAVAAMGRIAAAGALFLSRGDQSGTHLKEEALWQAAGVSPAAPWHRRFERGAQGSGLTLREADSLGAYTLVDRATYAKVAPARLTLLVEGDPLLTNLFSLLTLSPARFPAANHAGATRFVDWATSPEGELVIAGSGYFHPCG